MIERLLAAEAALERAELDVAGRLFGQVADADPRNAIAVVGLARVALRTQDRDAARELAQRALTIDPQEAAANRLLAELDAPTAGPAPSVAAAPSATPAPTPVARTSVAPMPAGAPPRSWWRRLLARILGGS